MKKSNKRRNPAYFFYKLLGSSFAQSFSARRLTRRFSPPMIHFPADLSTIKKLLIIMPDDPMHALHRIPLCIALLGRFKGAAVTLLCTSDVGPYLKGLQELVRIKEYDNAERFIGSKEVWTNAARLNEEQFSLTLVLERTPDIVLLIWSGATAAPIRAGFAGSGQYPFINMQFQNAQSSPGTANSNVFIASLFNAAVKPNFKWTVSAQTIEETAHLLRGYKIPAQIPLVGLDVDHCVQRCGRSWTEALIARLKQVPGMLLYASVTHAPDQADQAWLSQLSLPLIMQLPVPLLAGLLHQTAVVISGKSICGEMALLLHTAVVLLLAAEENDDFSALAQGDSVVVIGAQPEAKTIESIGEKVSTILAQASPHRDNGRVSKRTAG